MPRDLLEAGRGLGRSAKRVERCLPRTIGRGKTDGGAIQTADALHGLHFAIAALPGDHAVIELCPECILNHGGLRGGGLAELSDKQAPVRRNS